MKAAERKDLQSNTLKQFGNDLLHGGKKLPTLVWVLPLLAIVVWVVYVFWSGIVADRTTNIWANFWGSRGSSNEEQVKTLLKGTVAEMAWKLDRADRLYQQGYDNLFLRPSSGVEDLKKASELYEEISKSNGASPLMVLEALSGAAKCEECLGEVARAGYFYQVVIKRFGDDKDWTGHPLVIEARERQVQFSGNDERRTFAEKWLKDQLQMLDRVPPKQTEPDPIIPPIMGGRQ